MTQILLAHETIHNRLLEHSQQHHGMDGEAWLQSFHEFRMTSAPPATPKSCVFPFFPDSTLRVGLVDALISRGRNKKR